MSVAIVVPREYGYVIATVAFSFFLGFWHGIRAGLSRTSAGMKAPKAFADSTDMANARDPDHARAMYLFNCKQRAHLNYMELLPATAMSLLIAGFRYPHTSTALGVGWCFGRILYALGYTNLRKEDASGRILGFVLSQPLAFALWGLAGWTGLRLVM